MAASSSQALEYLEGLALQTHKKLYEQPSTVLAIFRCMLPHLAKSIVMAMLYMPTSFPSSELDAWFHPSARKEKEQALYILERLHILVSKLDAARQSSYSLYAGFQRSLRQALEGSGSHRSFGVPANKNEDPGEKVSVEFLDKFARTQWENILFYMVASTAEFAGNVGGEVGQGTKRLLAAGDFVRMVHGKVNITKEGFSFVLQETNAQVWTLLIVYLRHVSELGMSETDVLSFLFMLGSLELGQNYSTSTLSPTQKQMLEDLASMGIVYRSSKAAATFYPTRLAVTLTSDSGALNSSSTDVASAPAATGPTSSSGASKGFIVIETNYRLYAYTSSLIQIAILSLFTKLNHRFPNLVSGKLTKESISRAVKLGISSAQIISYLTTYAHAQMQKQTPFIPPTVMDQIRLWEYEGERVETTNGYLMREFHTESEYRDVLAYAEALGVLIWKNDAKRLFFISQIEQIQSYLKKKAQARGS